MKDRAMNTETTDSTTNFTEEQALKLFTGSGALLKGHFKLTSGRHSDIYYEKFTILKNPAVCEPLCRQMAQLFADNQVEVVVGPTTGGVLIAYEVAKALGTHSLYAEPGDSGDKRIFKRGFSLNPKQRVLIVDDIVTTGRSMFEVIHLVESYGAKIVGIGAMLDRSGGGIDLGYPLTALTTVSADSWTPEECPMCQQGQKLTQRGSRSS
jgi:orotate phosphoribosyltransferase